MYKLTNNGKGNFQVKDKRGNLVTLSQGESCEILDVKAEKLLSIKDYSFLEISKIDEVKQEVKEVKKEEVVENNEIELDLKPKKVKRKK